MDQIFRLLAAKERRRLLVALLDHNPQSIAPEEAPEDSGDPRRDIVDIIGMEHEENRYFVRMVHIHLPMLADAGVIKWDCETQEIHTGANFEQFRPILKLLTTNTDDISGECV